MTQPKRRNPSMSAAQMRAEKHVLTTAKVVEQWREYRSSTPIAAEVFLPTELCAALDDLVVESEAGPQG